MRAIDADALSYNFDGMMAVSPTGYIHGDTIADMIGDAPTIELEQKWIPCSERMPEKGQKCLVCDKGAIAIDTFIGNGKPYDWKWYMRDYEAWIPLPEPYKKENR